MLKSFSFLSLALALLCYGTIPAAAGAPDSYTPWGTPYTGTEIWYCERGGADGQCSIANVFTYPFAAALFASPPPIGTVTPNTGAFTNLSATGTVSGVGFTNLFAVPPPIGSTTPNTGAFTNLSASGTVSGAGFTTFNTALFAAPPPIGSTTPNTGAFTALNATGIVIHQNNVNVTNQGVDGATLFSTVGYGFPPQKSGFFTSGLNTPSLRYISVWFAQTAIYATTTRDSTMGETGLYLTWSDVTGYAPIGSGGKSKAAFQISGDCGSGGGACWDAAMSLQFDSGWAGVSGNFGSVLEIDPENNSGGTVPAVGATSEIFGVWIAGQIGTNPISSYLQISPAGINGAVFAAHYGINIGGTTAVQDDDINLTTHAVNAIADSGVHSGNGVVLQGSYSVTGLDITGTTPIGVSIISVNISTADINVATHATNSYVESGTHTGSAAVYQGTYNTNVINITGSSPTGINFGIAATGADINSISHATNMFVDSGVHTNGLVLQGTYSSTGIITTGKIDFHYDGVGTCAATGAIGVFINGVAHNIPYC